MASEYRSYLAANILNEDRVITYRLLSRALKVHVNLAKEMLFEFHRQQNAKKPGTVHATYLVAGSIHTNDQPSVNDEHSKDGEDSIMQSSPAFRSSPALNPQEAAEDTPVLSVTLVREEDLDELQKSYESVTSIHVYSLGPAPVKDIQTLSDASREIIEKHTTQDPLETASTYGTIINKGVRRRSGLRPPPIAVAAPQPDLKGKTSSLKEETKAPSPSKADQEAQPSRPSSKTGKDFFGKGTAKKEKPTPKDSPSSSNSAPLKRGSSGGIFASFAKAKPKVKREGTDTSDASPTVSAAASGGEDCPMKDVSEDEEETYVPPPQKAKDIVDSDRKSRKEREAALAKMMEDDDEEVEISPVAAETPDEEGSEMKEPPTSEVAKEYVEVSGGRRRGRRRVMKKKTTKDEEGYLVTKEEPAWESFSEDEPVIKAKPTTSSAPSGAKSKKSAGKPGQGNIMSFFAKKDLKTPQ